MGVQYIISLPDRTNESINEFNSIHILDSLLKVVKM